MTVASPWNARVRTIVRREYVQRVRSRWFLFSTLVVPVLFLAFSVVPVMLAEGLALGQRSVEILDATPGKVGASLAERLRSEGIAAERGRVPDGRGALDADALRARIRAGRTASGAAGRETSPIAWLYLPPDVAASGKAILIEGRELDPTVREALARALQSAVRTARLEEAGLSGTAIEEALRPASLERVPLRAEDGPSGFRTGLGLAFALVLYMMFMIYGQMIARGVLEEKTSDIVEILVSSARPWEMMLGKIVGIGAVGLTQVGIWAVLLIGVSALGLASLGAGLAKLGIDPSALTVPWELIGWSFVYFVIGYLLFSAVFAAAGAMVTTEQDVQQALWPVMIPVILPMMLLPIAMQAPDEPLVVVLSLLPFFSPIWMPIRIAASEVPLWQSLTAVTVLVLATLGLAWLAGKIFRMGLLMKGKRPNLPEIVRWLRHG